MQPIPFRDFAYSNVKYSSFFSRPPPIGSLRHSCFKFNYRQLNQIPRLSKSRVNQGFVMTRQCLTISLSTNRFIYEWMGFTQPYQFSVFAIKWKKTQIWSLVTTVRTLTAILRRFKQNVTVDNTQAREHAHMFAYWWNNNENQNRNH